MSLRQREFHVINQGSMSYALDDEDHVAGLNLQSQFTGFICYNLAVPTPCWFKCLFNMKEQLEELSEPFISYGLHQEMYLKAHNPIPTLRSFLNS